MKIIIESCHLSFIILIAEAVLTCKNVINYHFKSTNLDCADGTFNKCNQTRRLVAKFMAYTPIKDTNHDRIYCAALNKYGINKKELFQFACDFPKSDNVTVLIPTRTEHLFNLQWNIQFQKQFTYFYQCCRQKKLDLFKYTNFKRIICVKNEDSYDVVHKSLFLCVKSLQATIWQQSWITNKLGVHYGAVYNSGPIEYCRENAAKCSMNTISYIDTYDEANHRIYLNSIIQQTCTRPKSKNHMFTNVTIPKLYYSDGTMRPIMRNNYTNYIIDHKQLWEAPLLLEKRILEKSCYAPVAVKNNIDYNGDFGKYFIDLYNIEIDYAHLRAQYKFPSQHMGYIDALHLQICYISMHLRIDKSNISNIQLTLEQMPNSESKCHYSDDTKWALSRNYALMCVTNSMHIGNDHLSLEAIGAFVHVTDFETYKDALKNLFHMMLVVAELKLRRHYYCQTRYVHVEIITDHLDTWYDHMTTAKVNTIESDAGYIESCKLTDFIAAPCALSIEYYNNKKSNVSIKYRVQCRNESTIACDNMTTKHAQYSVASCVNVTNDLNHISQFYKNKPKVNILEKDDLNDDTGTELGLITLSAVLGILLIGLFGAVLRQIWLQFKCHLVQKDSSTQSSSGRHVSRISSGLDTVRSVPSLESENTQTEIARF